MEILYPTENKAKVYFEKNNLTT